MIQMLPANALIIPLYVVLARYHQVNQLSGLIVTYLTFVLPFSIWVLRGFIIGIPRDLEEAAMVDGNSRFTAFVKILLPLVVPGPRRDLDLRVHPGLERVHLRLRPALELRQADADVWLASFLGTSRGTDWGGLMAGATLVAIPVVDLLRDRAPADRLRPHRGRGARMSDELDRLAARPASSRASRARGARLDPARHRGRDRRDLPVLLQRRRPRAARAADRPAARGARRPADRDRRGGRRRDAARDRPRQLVSRATRALGVVDDERADRGRSRRRSAPTSPPSA